MKVTFLGVGCAADHNYTNFSMLLNANNQNILLDCGYNVFDALMKHNGDPEFLDAVWISHHHGDHMGSLPVLILRYHVDKRKKPLYVLMDKETKEKAEQVMKLFYPGVMEKLDFELKIIAFEKATTFGGLNISTAPTIHPVPNKAIRFELDDKVFVYSGDGMYTDEAKEIYRDADFLVHETYELEGEAPGHATIKDVAEIIDECEIKKVAVAHLGRKVRQNKEKVISFIKDLNKNIILPEEGDVITL